MLLAESWPTTENETETQREVIPWDQNGRCHLLASHRNRQSD